MFKQIEWTGEDRNIPDFGMATKGRVLTLPERKADSFISQGLATELTDAEDDAEVELVINTKEGDGYG